MKIIFLKPILSLTFCCLLFVACDSGDIYPTEDIQTGISVNANFRFEHVAAFPTTDYEILLGAFDAESTVPLSSKTIPNPQENTAISISLDNIPENTSYIRLCLAQPGKKTLYIFYETPALLTSTNKIEIPEQKIDLLKYERIQQQVFRQCVGCHGESNRVGGELYLIPDSSYQCLVSRMATKSTKHRVMPFNENESFLIDVLTKKDLGLSRDHTIIISSLKGEDVTLLEEWIKTGAENN